MTRNDLPQFTSAESGNVHAVRNFTPANIYVIRGRSPTTWLTSIWLFSIVKRPQDALLQCEIGYQPQQMRCKKYKEKDQKCQKCRLCRNCSKSWCGSKEHLVNFICMQTACTHCKDKKLSDDPKCSFCGVRCPICSRRKKKEFEIEPCPNTCGFRERTFSGKTAIQDFCHAVFLGSVSEWDNHVTQRLWLRQLLYSRLVDFQFYTSRNHF